MALWMLTKESWGLTFFTFSSTYRARDGNNTMTSVSQNTAKSDHISGSCMSEDELCVTLQQNSSFVLQPETQWYKQYKKM